MSPFLFQPRTNSRGNQQPKSSFRLELVGAANSVPEVGSYAGGCRAWEQASVGSERSVRMVVDMDEESKRIRRDLKIVKESRKKAKITLRKVLPWKLMSLKMKLRKGEVVKDNKEENFKEGENTVELHDKEGLGNEDEDGFVSLDTTVEVEVFSEGKYLESAK